MARVRLVDAARQQARVAVARRRKRAAVEQQLPRGGLEPQHLRALHDEAAILPQRALVVLADALAMSHDTNLASESAAAYLVEQQKRPVAAQPVDSFDRAVQSTLKAQIKR